MTTPALHQPENIENSVTWRGLEVCILLCKAFAVIISSFIRII